MYLLLFILILFLLIYFLFFSNFYESFQNIPTNCPNLLIYKNSKYLLLNTRLKTVPGVNPIVFDDLNDYTKFLEWQKSQGLHCPVLFLQQSYNTQGEKEFKQQPSVFEPQFGLPPSKLISKYQSSPQQPLPNQTSTQQPLPNQTSTEQPLPQQQPSQYFDSNIKYSYKPFLNYFYKWFSSPKEEQKNKDKYSDPMSKYWKGPKYTQKLIDKGYYSGNEVQIYIP
uniref:Uncharacterized protein n=1 Tax=viral metagenome TaxID=1070528 RepID=A0A6C0H4U4_9ZZZZ